FNRGFMKATERDGRLVLSDLRMGAEPDYSFNFAVAERDGGRWRAIPPEQLSWPWEARRRLAQMWHRIRNEPDAAVAGAPGAPAPAQPGNQERVKGKNAGAASTTESSRSISPPWPSIWWPQSLAPRLRLTADSASPPQAPAMTITVDMAAACSGANGVIHHSAVPMPTAADPPPTRPSTVLDGLTTGASLRRPSSLPNTYCITSLICTTSIR